VEVIEGLTLVTFEGGDIILTEGEPGSSLFVLTSGLAKAFVRNPQGKHVFVRALREGDFFGEISIMTGKPRTATVTAATRCELLELDRVALDSIAQRKPHVREVMQDFYVLRANSLKERRIRGGK
jgi:cAMP-dependent protein kinase regulator